MLAFIGGVALSGPVDKWVGKRNGVMILTLLNALTVIGFFFIPREATVTMFVVNLIGSFLAGPTPALVWALYADVADYGERKFGRRATALVFSAAMFAQKMGLTLGGAGAGWMLDAFGFRPNTVQDETSLLGIRLMFSIVPGSLAVLNAVILWFYPLGRAETEQMQAELAKRRAAENEDATNAASAASRG